MIIMVKAQKKNKQYEEILKKIQELKEVKHTLSLSEESIEQLETTQYALEHYDKNISRAISDLNNKVEDLFRRMNENMNVLSTRFKDLSDDKVLTTNELRLNLYKHIATCGLIAFVSLLFFLYNYYVVNTPQL